MPHIIKSMTSIFKSPSKSKDDMRASATAAPNAAYSTTTINGGAAAAKGGERRTKLAAASVGSLRRISKSEISGPTASHTTILGHSLYDGQQQLKIQQQQLTFHKEQLQQQQHQHQHDAVENKTTRRKKTKRPIYGVALLQLDQSHGKVSHVPRFVVELVSYIERNFIRKDGLYRVSGRSLDIANLRRAINTSYTPKLFENVDVNVLTSILKLFFRELPESLIPSQACDLFHNKNTDIEITNGLRKIFEELPHLRAATIQFLIRHFVHVASHSYENRMTAYNLATVWGPTLVWVENICEIPLTSQLLKTLIQNYNFIFNEL